MKKLYLVSPLANKKEVDKYCFKECGEILVGGVDFMDAHWLPCRTEKCPYEEKHQSFGKEHMFGEDNEIIVRKLRGG